MAKQIGGRGILASTVGALAALTVLATAAATAATPAPPAPDDAAFFPLGVYWPGEYTFRAADGTYDWPKMEATLDSLAQRHCNTVWLTHTGAADAAEFARRAAKRGIHLVASLGELDGGLPQFRNADQAPRIAAVRQAWGDAPPPLAFGMGDEPRADYMQEMAKYVDAWAKAGLPTTTVVMAGDAASAAASLNLKILCSDIYPFFGAGDPNGPDTIAESAAYVREAGGRVQYWAKKRGMEYWFMGAIFQEPWGPRDVDEKGNIVYVAGGGPHFRYPSCAEVKWQNWAALATGARGLVHFTLFMGQPKPAPNEKPLPPDLPFGVKERTNSNTPGGMLYPDGRPTPQFDALGESFARIRKVAAVLKTIEPVESQVAFHSKGWIPPGDIVQVLRCMPAAAAPGGPGLSGPGRSVRAADEGTFYVIVVNGDMEKTRDLPVNVQPEVLRVVNLTDGGTLPLITRAVISWEPVGPPFRQARVRLPPGEGALLKLLLKSDLPFAGAAISGVPMPDWKPAQQADGSRCYAYKADLQKDRGAADALTSGAFQDHGKPEISHMNGVCCGDTAYLFELPEAIASLKASGMWGNHADSANHNYGIFYSLDGVEYKPLAEKAFGAGDGLTVTGEVHPPPGTKRVWLSYRMAGNGLIVLKRVEVELWPAATADK